MGKIILYWFQPSLPLLTLDPSQDRQAKISPEKKRKSAAAWLQGAPGRGVFFTNEVKPGCHKLSHELTYKLIWLVLWNIFPQQRKLIGSSAQNSFGSGSTRFRKRSGRFWCRASSRSTGFRKRFREALV